VASSGKPSRIVESHPRGHFIREQFNVAGRNLTDLESPYLD
jgi:hypothetical protein